MSSGERVVSSYFGACLDAPAYADAVQVAPPVGQSCFGCGEVIVEGEDGWLRPVGIGGSVPGCSSLEPIHRECELAGLLGHLLGAAWGQVSTRDQARALLRSVCEWVDGSVPDSGVGAGEGTAGPPGAIPGSALPSGEVVRAPWMR